MYSKFFIVEGAENKDTLREIFEDLIERGLKTKKPNINVEGKF